MDEPFEGVDALGARLMKNILLEQVRRGATVFLTSHVLEVVERLCDHVAIVSRGKILAQGTVSELRLQTAEASTLEDIFVQLVGIESRASSLDWL
jgi:ABC-2 type transport system ATP-binding protein